MFGVSVSENLGQALAKRWISVVNNKFNKLYTETVIKFFFQHTHLKSRYIALSGTPTYVSLFLERHINHYTIKKHNAGHVADYWNVDLLARGSHMPDNITKTS